jgi:acetolactate synthase-1/2/3 large subunit
MDTNKSVTIPVETVGQAYLEILRARGIKYFFGNSGTDFGPIIDALAKFAADKKTHPMPITVPHEFVAVSMAQGYAMITGEPQVVMVHVIVGTGNASAAVMNASRLNVPMIFSAGRTPLTEEGLRGSRSNFMAACCVSSRGGTTSCAMAIKWRPSLIERWKWRSVTRRVRFT